MTASMLVSAGLGLAAAREAAAVGGRAASAALLAGLVLGLLASTVAAAMTANLGYSFDIVAASSALALSMTVAQASLWAVLGYEAFRMFFAAQLLGSLAKLATLLALVALGAGALAALLGYLAGSLASSSTAVAYMVVRRLLGRPSLKLGLRLATLHASNYLLVVSAQLPIVLSVYAFAYTAPPVDVGSLYISFMVVLALATVPGSLLGASLPIAVRRSVDPFIEAYRLGTGAVAPLAAAVAVASTTILSALNPELARGSQALTVLALGLPLLVYLHAAMMRMNARRELRSLAAMGVARLAALLALLATLSQSLGVLGAALAYLASAAVVLPLASLSIGYPTTLLAYQAILLAGYVAAHALPHPLQLALPPVLVVALQHLLGLLRIGELRAAASIAVAAILGGRGARRA
jgi:O-antigen/teichoic acid export membrane protein